MTITVQTFAVFLLVAISLVWFIANALKSTCSNSDCAGCKKKNVHQCTTEDDL